MNVFINKLNIWSRSQKNRDLLIQFIFLIFVGLFVYYLASKARLLDMTLSHFSSRAGFGISHTFIVDYKEWLHDDDKLFSSLSKQIMLQMKAFSKNI